MGSGCQDAEVSNLRSCGRTLLSREPTRSLYVLTAVFSERPVLCRCCIKVPNRWWSSAATSPADPVEQARPPGHRLRRDHRRHPQGPARHSQPDLDGYDDTSEDRQGDTASREDLFETPMVHTSLPQARTLPGDWALCPGRGNCYARACPGVPTNEKIVEDLGYTEDLVLPGVPNPPRRPNPPR